MRPVWPLAAAAACLCPASLQASPGPDDRPNLYLVAVAVEDYDDTSLNDLNYTEDDSSAVGWWAQAQADHVYSEVYVTSLRGKDATRQHIISKLQEVSRQAQATDQIILFLAGHGVVEPQSNRYHYLPVDTVLSNVAGTGLAEADILELLRPRGQTPQRLAIWIDTCQSGKIVDPSSGRGLQMGDSSRYFATNQEVSPALTGPTVQMVLAASGSLQQADEVVGRCTEGEPADIKGHGVFTCALIKGLTRSSKVDGYVSDVVTFNGLREYMEIAVPGTSLSSSQNMSGTVKSSGGGGNLPVGWIPGTVERCDGKDNDLNGQIDEGYPKAASGRATCMEAELCNGIDDDVDGEVDEGLDQDGDGWWPVGCTQIRGRDCNDQDAGIYPGQIDWADLKDNNCNGAVDEDSPVGRGNLPRSVDQLYQEHQHKQWAAVGATSLALGLTMVGLTQLGAMEGAGGPWQEFRNTSAVVCSLGVLSAVGVGFSWTWGSEAWEFRQSVVIPTRDVVSSREDLP